MPDSTPPFGWGSASFDERDLDDLLSGRLADTPRALRQVADALVALRGGPTPAELSGEAAVMAEFSAFAESRSEAHTLMPPAPPSDLARKRGARHRSRRARAGLRPPSWRAGALAGVAAAAVIVTIVAFGGFLPGPIRSFTRPAISSSATTQAATGTSGSQNVAAKTAAPERPAPTPSHSASAHPATTAPPDGRTLCRTWFADFGHPQPHSKWPAELSLFWQISKLVGGPWKVFPYCAPYVRDMLPRGNPWFHGGGPDSHQDGPGTGPGSTGPGSTGPSTGPGDSGSSTGPGDSGSSTGPGDSGSSTGPGDSGSSTGPGDSGSSTGGSSGTGSSGTGAGTTGSNSSGPAGGPPSSGPASGNPPTSGAGGQGSGNGNGYANGQTANPDSPSQRLSR